MKSYSIEYDRRAEKQLRAIKDLRLAIALQEAIAALVENPRPPGCSKMAGPGDEWRIRVGDWRVVYRIDDGRVVVIVVRVAPRGGEARPENGPVDRFQRRARVSAGRVYR